VVRNKYRILAKIGQGGMGAVYKALHLRFKEVRALKVLSPELASDAEFVKRFEREAILTRKLQHPHAVRIDDIDESDDGRPFIVMEFIEGRSLKRVIEEEGPLPFARACAISKQVAGALDAAHRLGVIHRDIKPDNIALVTPAEDRNGGLQTSYQEFAKVLDFGIAKVKEASLVAAVTTTLTKKDMVIGTPQYMSPEQAMGKRGDDLDARSDIYSLGIVMYQMLTGELPFKGDTTLELLLAHMQLPPTPIQEVRPDLQIPRGVADVVMRCLAKNRELRPASAQALIEELERAEEGLFKELAPTRLITTLFPEPVEPVPPAPEPQVVPQPEPPGPPEPEPDVITEPEPPAPPESAPPVVAEPEPPMPPKQEPEVITEPEPPAPPAPAPPLPEPKVVSVPEPSPPWQFKPRVEIKPEPVVMKPQPAASPGPKFRMVEGGVSRSPFRPTRTIPAVILLTGLFLGVWYFAIYRPPEPSNLSVPSVTNPPQITPDFETTSQPSRRTSHTRKPAQITQPAPTNNPDATKKVEALLTEGDAYYQNGDYDNAIATYQRGLALEPGNAELLGKIAKAKNAKAAEGTVNP